MPRRSCCGRRLPGPSERHRQARHVTQAAALPGIRKESQQNRVHGRPRQPGSQQPKATRQQTKGSLPTLGHKASTTVRSARMSQMSHRGRKQGVASGGCRSRENTEQLLPGTGVPPG